MTDQEDKEKKTPDIVGALNRMASTKDGAIFLIWLKNRCFFDRSTIVGDPTSREVNMNASIGQEFQRRIYLDIRRELSPEIRQKIEQ